MPNPIPNPNPKLKNLANRLASSGKVFAIELSSFMTEGSSGVTELSIVFKQGFSITRVRQMLFVFASVILYGGLYFFIHCNHRGALRTFLFA